MKWKEWLDKWSMSKLEINTGILKTEWKPNDYDKDAAWDLYVELLTRVSTQYLAPAHGDEKTALESIHKLFDLTRNTLKTRGRHCNEFAKIAIVVLNQVVRPFTAKWHKESLGGAFEDPARCQEFREELSGLQADLRQYTKMLAHMGKVENLTKLEKTESK